MALSRQGRPVVGPGAVSKAPPGRQFRRALTAIEGVWGEMWLSRTYKQLATGFVP